jgi:hypothetical protein
LKPPSRTSQPDEDEAAQREIAECDAKLRQHRAALEAEPTQYLSPVGSGGCAVSGPDRVIRWSTAAAVIGVAVVAAVVSYEHAYGLVHAHGEIGWTARLIPLTVDGLIWASSMVMLDSARRGARVPVPALARWLLGLGIAATLAANVAHGLGHGPVGAAVGAWPALALVGSYELLMMIIRGAQLPGESAVAPAETGMSVVVPLIDALHARAIAEFADDVAAGRTPFIRVIRARLHIGQTRAQQVRAFLAATAQQPKSAGGGDRAVPAGGRGSR